MNQTGNKGQEIIFEQLKNWKMTQKQTVLILKLSLRKIKRKVKKYAELEASSLVHNNCSKPSNRKIDTELVNKIIDSLNVVRNIPVTIQEITDFSDL